MARTLGQYLINDIIPEDLRDPDRVFNKKSAETFFLAMAERHPDKYIDTMQSLMNVSRVAGTEQGGLASIRLSDLKMPDEVKKYREVIKNNIVDIQQDRRKSPEQKNKEIVEYMRKEMPVINKIVLDSTSKGNNSLGESIKHGFRGSPVQLTQLLFGDILVADQAGRPIPVPGINGYAQGAKPMEYFAGSFSSRKGYCLAKGTKVRMADGTQKSIEDINVGEYVLGSDKKGNTFPTQVVNTYDNGIKQVYSYRFRLGRTHSYRYIECTEDHKVLGEWTTGSLLRRKKDKYPIGTAKKNFGITLSKGNNFNGIPYDTTKAFLLGLLIGDGHFSVQNSITLTTSDIELVDALNELLQPLNWYLKYKERNRKSKMPSYEYVLLDLDRKNKFSSNSAKAWIANFGLLGKKSYEKVIPPEVMTWDNNSVCAFINGFFEADGGSTISGITSTPVIRYHSTSEELLKGIRYLLETRLGIYCTDIIHIDKKNIPESSSYGYTIKASRDAYVLSYSDRQSVLYRSQYLTTIGKKGKKVREIIHSVKSDGRSQDTRLNYVSTSVLGTRSTYDLEVDHEDHLFVLANGMVVSNSDTQFMTAKSGFLGKQLALASSRVQVVEDDCGASDKGIIMLGDNSDVIGRVLAKDVGNVPAGTTITKKHLPAIQDKKLLVRSLITCQSGNGICRRCAGKRDKGNFPEIGAYVGVDTGRLLSEPLTQSGLSSKHTGGIIGGKQFSDELSGFEEVNQFLQVPKHFRGGSVLSNKDGIVQSISDAPQGGKYITVGGEAFYASPARDVLVTVGDQIEQGDMLTDGTPNPAEMAKYKGIGDARLYFVNKFGQILKNNGINVKQRHVETLARGFFDRVKITDIEGPNGHVIDDIVTYSDIQRNYQPRKDSIELSPDRAVGKYLEQPVLHYSIGTRITPKVAKFLKEEQIKSIKTHDAAPGFEPAPMRIMDIPGTDPDFKNKLTGFNLKKNLLEDIRLGGTSKHDDVGYASKLMDPTRL